MRIRNQPGDKRNPEINEHTLRHRADRYAGQIQLAQRMILSMVIGFIRADVLLLLAVANSAPVLFSMVFG